MKIKKVKTVKLCYEAERGGRCMSGLELRPLSTEDGHMVYRLLQRIPAHENGFYNEANGLSYKEYKKWLFRRIEIEKGINLKEGMVKESIYWFLLNEIPIGIGKLRHSLTPALEQYGGNLSYSITPKQRNNGYGTILLGFLLQEARRLEIPGLLVTIYNYNYPSEKVILKNEGICFQKTDLRSYYRWNLQKAKSIDYNCSS